MRRECEGSEAGYTLIEVMVAAAIIGVMCTSMLSVMLKIDTDNRAFHDENIAYRACHQMIEVLMADDLDSMLLQKGNTFQVDGLSAGTQTGTIDIIDLNWGPAGDTADKAYQIRLDVPAAGVTLSAIRSRT
jgi:prepilin-type N-terminal cleavage/methylation domain-containing protein